jgi:hypothetical protein
MTIVNRVLVREPPEYPRIEDFHRTNQMTDVTLTTHSPRGFVDQIVAVPSRLPDIVRIEERLYVRGSHPDGKWREATVWPIFEKTAA